MSAGCSGQLQKLTYQRKPEYYESCRISSQRDLTDLRIKFCIICLTLTLLPLDAFVLYRNMSNDLQRLKVMAKTQ